MENVKKEVLTDYELVYKNKAEKNKAAYKVEYQKTGWFVWLTKFNGLDIEPLLISAHIKETKRGWTYIDFDLSGKQIAIFLDRQLWDKVLISAN